jgi:hypothetical protein
LAHNNQEGKTTVTGTPRIRSCTESFNPTERVDDMALPASGNHIAVYLEDPCTGGSLDIEVVIEADGADIADPPRVLTMAPWDARWLAGMLTIAAECAEATRSITFDFRSALQGVDISTDRPGVVSMTPQQARRLVDVITAAAETTQKGNTE